jgi:hypothetical protein
LPRDSSEKQFQLDKKEQGILNIFQIFAADVAFLKMISIYFSLALLLELDGFIPHGTSDRM